MQTILESHTIYSAVSVTVLVSEWYSSLGEHEQLRLRRLRGFMDIGDKHCMKGNNMTVVIIPYPHFLDNYVLMLANFYFQETIERYQCSKASIHTLVWHIFSRSLWVFFLQRFCFHVYCFAQLLHLMFK